MLKKVNTFTQLNFFLCNANTVVAHPQSLNFFYLTVDHLQNNISSLMEVDM